jgi:hypothetical protein
MSRNDWLALGYLSRIYPTNVPDGCEPLTPGQDTLPGDLFYCDLTDSWEPLYGYLLEVSPFLVSCRSKSSKGKWYCESPGCNHRENDVGHACWWCGSPPK